jgi:hypothetical protein
MYPYFTEFIDKTTVIYIRYHQNRHILFSTRDMNHQVIQDVHF